MHRSFTSTYLFPAICLNPILFLHTLNTILSRILPPTVSAEPIQPPPYSRLGPSANHPHLDLHASDSLCWSYTLLIIFTQLFAYNNINIRRSERREHREREAKMNGNGKANGYAKAKKTEAEDSYFGKESMDPSSADGYPSTKEETEEEVVL